MLTLMLKKGNSEEVQIECEKSSGIITLIFSSTV